LKIEEKRGAENFFSRRTLGKTSRKGRSTKGGGRVKPVQWSEGSRRKKAAD